MENFKIDKITREKLNHKKHLLYIQYIELNEILRHSSECEKLEKLKNKQTLNIENKYKTYEDIIKHLNGNIFKNYRAEN